MENDKFKFFLPVDDIIEKGKDPSGKEIMSFKGIASTNDKDSQGESLDPGGFDLSNFKWVNWNHLGSKDSATIIGEIAKASLTPKNELYIEGLLYPEVQMAKNTWTLMKALKNSPSGNKLSLSVEGKVLERASDDKENPLYNKILKSRITGVAICPTPINGKTWVDFLQKGYTEDNSEEYDDETQKAITAAVGEGVTQKEDVEGAKNKSLKKSEIYEKIYDKFPTINIEKAKSVYKLIEKTATMSKETQEISAETITKAFSILEVASEEIVKSSNSDKDKDKEKEEKEEKEKKEKEEGEMKKAQTTYSLLKGEELGDDLIKTALLKKGFSEDIIKKIMVEENKVAVNGLSKAEVEEIVKAQATDFNTKFDAVKIILKSQVEENTEIKKSLETMVTENNELKGKIETLSKTPGERKSQVITKSYSDKFEKSENGEKINKKFNLNDKVDRAALKLAVTEMSGINKGEGFDKQLVGIAQELELTHKLTKAADIQRLVACGFELVAE